MYLSLSVPSDRIDVYRAAAAALLAAAAIISLILLISPVQELEAEINSFRLSGGGPAARSSAASAADPTPTPSPTVAVLSAPVLTAQASEDGVELSWTTVHGATRYELFVWDSVNEWRQIGGDSLTATTYTYTDLVAGATYFYIIRAANADGETSAWSDQVSTVTATATATHTPAATATATHTPAATVTATHTPAATTGQPSDSSQNDVTVKGDSGNEGNVSPGQTSEDKTRTEPRQGLSGPTVSITGGDGVVVVGGENQVNGASFNVTITFSENVGATFDHTDITVTNAQTLAATDVSASTAGLIYIATVRPTAGFSGTVTVQVPADAAQNASNEGNQASNVFSVTATHTPAATATSTNTPTATAASTLPASATATPTATVLPAPDLTVVSESADAIELSWTEVSGAVRYEPRAYTAEEGWTYFDDTAAGVTTFTHRGLVAGREYYYWVRGVPAEGKKGLWSVRQDTTASDVQPTATATHTPTATTAPPSDSSQNDVTVKDDSGNEGDVSPGQTSEDKTRTEPRQGLTGPTVTIAGADGVMVVGGDNQVNGASFDVLITFSENVGATFDHMDITVTNAETPTATDVIISTAGLIYTATIRPTAGFSGTVSVQVPADAAENTSNVGNQVSNVFSATATLQSACVSGGAVPAGDEYADLARECAILLGLHDTLVGSSTSLNWSEDTLMTLWNGVFVVSNRVTFLVLTPGDLSGTIPAELGDLTELKFIRLGSNDLTGSIPTELGNLTNMTILDLTNNELTGSIPTELGSLANLDYLDLSSNDLTGTIPTELGSLANLTTLDLSGNNLAGGIPTQLRNLTNLEELDLDYNNLTGIIPTELASLANLTDLELNNNDLMGGIPTQLGNLTNLEILRLSDNRLTGSIPTQLGSLANLDYLDLSSNDLTGTIPTELGNLTNLDYLDLSSNDLTGTIPTQLDNLVPPNGMLDWVSIPTGNPSLCGPIPTALHGLVPTIFGFTDLDSIYYPGGTIGSCLDSSFEQSSYTVGEGSSIAITVTLSVDPERTVTIPITKTNQGGAADVDYSGVPNSLTFNSGDTEKSFTFTAVQDSVDDDGESVLLRFGTLPTGVSAGTNNEATVNISDDDVPAVTVRYEQASYTVGEGSSVDVKVILSAEPERSVTVPISRTNQGGATDGDYSGLAANTSVTFNSGDTEKSFTFAATQDTDDDDDESVLLGFGTLPTGVSLGTNGESTVNITDDDVPSVTVRYEQASYTVGEGSSVDVKVILSADPERSVTVPISRTNQGGATDGDYSGVGANTSVTFNSGDTEKSFTFTAVQDSVDDDGESVLLGFGTLPTGVSLGINGESTVNITDNDVPSVTVRYEQGSYTVGEGSSEVIKVILSAVPERSVTVPISRTNQGGATDGDYSGVAANASVTFNSDETEKIITFTATDDSVDDDGESVLLGFGTLPTGVSLGTNGESTVNITDDDVPSVTVRYEQGSYTVGEGSSEVIKVILSAVPERSVTISIRMLDLGGATTDDYSVVPTSLTFNSGETEKSITFAATEDSVNDDGESVRLGFGTLPTGVSRGTHRGATVNITDNDTGQALNTVCGGPVSNLKGVGASATRVLFNWGPPAGGCRLQTYIVEFSVGNGPECGADGSSSFDWTGSVKRVMRLPASGISLTIWGGQTNGPIDNLHEGARRHLRVKSVFVDSSESATFSGGVCAKVLSEENE